MSATPEIQIDKAFAALRIWVKELDYAPVIDLMAAGHDSPWKLLASTMLSARTKDAVTTKASKSLFSRADTPEKTAELSVEELAELIYPVGFYRTKAENLKKLAEAIGKYGKIKDFINGLSPQEFLDQSTEEQIANTFDRIKEAFGRDVFGQGYIYKLIDDSEIANIDSLTEDEKANGIDPSKPYYVPYDKGDKDGNRWYLETPFAIAWSKENVQFLKTDPKARYQGYTFFFKEGLCWSDINTTFLKCRKKQKNSLAELK